MHIVPEDVGYDTGRLAFQSIIGHDESLALCRLVKSLKEVVPSPASLIDS